jgi:hypothetical protein
LDNALRHTPYEPLKKVTSEIEVKRRKVSVYSSKSSLAVLKNMNKVLILNTGSTVSKEIEETARTIDVKDSKFTVKSKQKSVIKPIDSTNTCKLL